MENFGEPCEICGSTDGSKSFVDMVHDRKVDGFQTLNIHSYHSLCELHMRASSIYPDPATLWSVIVDGEKRPEPGRPVFLWDGKRCWVGSRQLDGDLMTWGTCLGQFFWDGKEWSGDFDADDMSPTHWHPLPDPTFAS